MIVALRGILLAAAAVAAVEAGVVANVLGQREWKALRLDKALRVK